MVDQASTIDSAARVSHATAEIDFTIGHLRRESSTFATMESATPKKFKSNVLAALDVGPGIDDLENYNPLLTHMKRKQTPGSPDPRLPKRAAAGVRPSIPGLENVPCGCSSDISSDTGSYPTSIFSLRCVAATAINSRVTEGSPSRVRHTLQ
jgi:hypothetical protein